MGVRKAQEAPTATCIKKGSIFAAIDRAMPTLLGGIMSAVAALFITSGSHMLIDIIKAKSDQAGSV